MGRGFDSVQDKQQRDNLRETDIFEILSLSQKANNQWVSLRFLPGDLLPIKKHWIKIMGGKDKDKPITIPRMCVSFDPDNQEKPLEGRDCPYCGIQHGNDETGAPARVDFKYLAQAISRDAQESKPRKLKPMTKKEKSTGKKEMTSDSWTPVVVVPLTPGVARKIKEYSERNFHEVKDKKTKKKTKTAFPLSHAKYGLDVDIKYNPKAAGAEKYSVDKGAHTPLTEEELEYLTWDFEDWNEIYDLLGRLDTQGALKDFKSMDVQGQDSESDDEDDDDDDGMSLGKKKKGAKADKKKRRSMKDDDDEDDDEDEDDEPKKKAKKTKSRHMIADDEDEDDEPKKKKKSSKVKSKKSKSDDDEDDDAPKKKKKKKSSDDAPKKKKKK